MKKLISLILAACMCINIGIMPIFAVESRASGNTTAFAGGRGTEDDPYLISLARHLNNVRMYPDAHFKMVADIVFTDADFAEGGAYYNKGAGWQPIKSHLYSYRYFTGEFDGNGYSIYNLQINVTSDKSIDIGLFEQNEGTIKNLGMEDFEINLTLTADVYGCAGGIAGENFGTIINCFSVGRTTVNDTEGNGYAGGITGWNSADATVSECYNMGTVFGTHAAGGITGMNSGLTSNCYNTGFIRAENSQGYNYAGGIAGTNHDQIADCYNVGYVASNVRKGGITGISISGEDITNCYYLDSCSTGTGYDDEGTTKCTEEHFKRQDTFGGFDFESVWTMEGSGDYLYPELVNTTTKISKKLLGVTLLSLPYKTQYYAGIENFDVSGGKLALVYSDGTYSEIDITNAIISGFDNTQIGAQTITVTYEGQAISFGVEVLALVYDSLITTDEQITLEYTANKEFSYVLSDNTVAKITNVSSSVISWGSRYEMTSAATIVPLKPGYVVVRAIDTDGKILTNSLLLIEEGEHKMILSEVLKEVNCTEPGNELHVCKFCGYEEEVTIPNPGHTEVIDEAIAPTCTKTGLTEGKHCSACNEVLISQNVIDETGEHIWDDGSVDEAGNIHYSCDTCEITRTKTLMSIGVTKLPDKILYMEGDSDISCEGMVVTAYYDDETSAVISSYYFSWSGPFSPPTETVKVTYKSKSTTFEIAVEARVPSSVTSSAHTVSGNNISKITVGTTVSQLLANLNEGEYCKVYKGNSVVDDDAFVGTGMTVKIMDGNTVKATYTVIVTGDTNGDGDITITDMIAVKAHVLEKTLLSGVYAKTADTSGEGDISVTDFLQVKAKILGKGEITAR